MANITYPDVYQRFLDGVDVLNFDLSWVFSAGCFMDVDFHDRLLLSTIGPIAVMVLLAGTFAVAERRNRGSQAALQKVQHKHVSMLLLVTFLVYSSVSATVFQMFACEHLADGKDYLRADYRIECDSSKHRALLVYAGIMILVYPVGIPLLYSFLLYRSRAILRKPERDQSAEVSSMSDLWAPYKPERYYYEVIECARRILLTGVVVFIYPNTAAQVAVTLVLAVVFTVFSEHLCPYGSCWDARVSLAGHLIVFLSMYVALLLRVDVSEERDSSQRVFAAILVTAHACLVLAACVEAVVLTLSVRQREEPVSKTRSKQISPFFEEFAPSHGSSSGRPEEL